MDFLLGDQKRLLRQILGIGGIAGQSIGVPIQQFRELLYQFQDLWMTLTIRHRGLTKQGLSHPGKIPRINTDFVKSGLLRASGQSKSLIGSMQPDTACRCDERRATQQRLLVAAGRQS